MYYLTRTILLAVCLMVLPAASIFVFGQENKSDNWFPVRVNGKTGFIDRSGKVVIEPKFDGASYFSEGLAAVAFGRDTIFTEGYSQGFIDEDGKIIIRPRWDVVSRFSEGLAAVGMDQTKKAFKVGDKTIYSSASHTWYRWGFIDKKGNLVIEAKFSDISEFRNGLAVANTDPYEPKYGFIDEQGEWIIQPKFENANQFSEGLARVFQDGKYGFIDRKGNICNQATVFMGERFF